MFIDKLDKGLFDQIIDAENLFWAWDQYKKGKRNKPDVMEFESELEINIFNLHRQLKNKTYRHEAYSGFFIYDPKLRHVHKATVRDRVLHHAVFSGVNPVFEPTFINNSFSCRIGKGTHYGFNTIEKMLCAESHNNTRVCYALKCDIKKFFDTVDHSVLISILRRRIHDKDLMWLLEEIVGSYEHGRRGVPIGNLTSQVFANIYMGEFDRFVKHILRVKHYGRYTDDFIIVSHDRDYLEGLIEPMRCFIKEHLRLELHPDKISIRRYSHGIDFLGYVAFPHHRLMRKKTKNRIQWKLKSRFNEHKRGLITKEKLEQSLNSYLGALSHANAHNFSERLKNKYFFG